jgi:hypothetical protein
MNVPGLKDIRTQVFNTRMHALGLMAPKATSTLFTQFANEHAEVAVLLQILRAAHKALQPSATQADIDAAKALFGEYSMPVAITKEVGKSISQSPAFVMNNGGTFSINWNR